MNIEKDIFKRSKVNYNKLTNYGFKKEKDSYIYEENFINNTFKAIITINNNIIKGRVIDLDSNEEYSNIRTEMNGEFVNKVRNEYINILNNIRNNCFETTYFISNQANRITNYIKKKYNNNPEFLWKKFKGYGVFRNSHNNKWYAIIMDIDLSKLDNNNSKEVEILNLKLEEKEVNSLLKQTGFYKAYHMNKKDWISLILNDTISDDIIINLLDKSYEIINKKK